MKYWGVILLLLLSACSSNPRVEDQQGVQNNTEQLVEIDKYESFNRAMFGFNMSLDRWILKPIAKGYKAALPSPIRTGVGNFFNNIFEVTNIFNDILQWKWHQAGHDTGRFLLNTTLGIAGIFDVASKSGLAENDREDFGQTLAVWGVKQGPYLVLPFFGPSSVRGAGGMLVDWYSTPLVSISSQTAYWGLIGLDAVDARAGLLEVEELASGDLYLFLRDAYLQRRKYLISDGKIIDEFGSDFDDDFDDWGDDFDDELEDSGF